MCVYQKLIFITIYVILIIASSFVLEWILLNETGYTSYQIVEPLGNLSVSQLQALLCCRGIDYAYYLEKWEIIESLHLSGKVHYMEFLEALSPTTEFLGPKEIFGKDEYYEQVLESLESIWVIEVIPGGGNYSDKRLLDSDSWKTLNKKLQPLGISSAVIRCKYEPHLCTKENWNHPQLMLVAPKPGSKDKIILVLPSTRRLSVSAAMQWIRVRLSSLVPSVQSLQELQKLWLNTTVVQETKVPQMIYISEMLNPPLLIVALGLRFSSRIRLSFLNVRCFDKEAVTRTLNTYKLNSPPTLVVTSSNAVSVYGKRKGEYMSSSSLDIYVRLMKPKMNDVFLISLLITNFLAFVNFLDFRRSLGKHLVRTLFCIPVYNIFVFVSWLTLSAVVKFTWIKPIFDSGLWMGFETEFGWLMSFLQYYIVVCYHFKGVLMASLFLFAVIVCVYQRIVGIPIHITSQESDNWYSVFSMDSYLVNVLFRPMASLSRPRPSHDLDLEEGMERLIQRLATPDLWLHPVVPTEYIKDLPTWRYDGWGNEDDLKSESETDFDSLSEAENDSLLETHSCCQDEGCKMCSLWATVKETYVCHRCAILKRKLEKKYLKFRNFGNSAYQNITYEKLLKVCANCSRTKRNHPNTSQSRSSLGEQERFKKQWLMSVQRLHELKWSAPSHAIETRVCAICLDRYRWSAVLCGLPCGHTYHHSCIMEWLSKDNHQCPTCRWPSYKTKLNNIL